MNFKKMSRLWVYCCAALTISCGGDMGSLLSDSGVGTGGTGSISVGPISGFGSVIVNGVRFDDSKAVIENENGDLLDSSALGLGMMAEVVGYQTDTSTGVANTIRVFSEILGPVNNIDTNQSTFTVLGQIVKINDATVFSGISGIADLNNASIIEAWGVSDTINNQFIATRIELKTTPVAEYKISGDLPNVNTSTTTKQECNTGLQAAIVCVPSSVENSVSSGLSGIESIPNISAGLAVVSVKYSDKSKIKQATQGTVLEMEGVVSSVIDGSYLVLNNVTVKFDSAQIEKGTLADIQAGAMLEIKGALNSSGILIAQEIDVQNKEFKEKEFELHGSVSNFVDVSNFLVRNVRVNASNISSSISVSMMNQIKNGAKIEVHGRLISTPQGSVLSATRIELD
jgi:hypothetical protein